MSLHINEKVPSFDGLSCEFYKVMWDFVSSKLMQGYKKDLQKTSLSVNISRGSIKFILGEGYHKLITN
jgi:hypothetical protein